MAVGIFKSPALEQLALGDRVVRSMITWNCHSTPASQTIYSDNPDIIPYIANGTDPSAGSVDPLAAFGNLANTAAPSTFGLIVQCKDARLVTGLVGLRVPTETIINNGGLAMTGAVVTPKGVTAGVTTLQNLAAVLSCTGLNASAFIAAVTFWVEVIYKVKKGGV